jgi:transcription initiation factor TFIID subunit TAF12
MFEEGGHGNTENLPPHVISQLQASSSKHPLQQQQHQQQQQQQQQHQQQHNLSAGNKSLNSSNRTPNSFVNSSQAQSVESFDRVTNFISLNITLVTLKT